MTLDEQIKAAQAELAIQKGRQSMSLDERRFDRDSWTAINEMEMKWIDVAIKVDKHIVEMANKWLDYNLRVSAVKALKIEMKRRYKQRRKIEIQIARNERRMNMAERLYEGEYLTKSELVGTWREFGRLVLRSRQTFPGTDLAFAFEGEETYVTIPPMKMYSLAQYCRNNKLTIAAEDPAFDSIDQAFNEIGERQIEAAEVLEKKLAAAQQRVDDVNEKRWAKAGVI